MFSSFILCFLWYTAVDPNVQLSFLTLLGIADHSFHFERLFCLAYRTSVLSWLLWTSSLPFLISFSSICNSYTISQGLWPVFSSFAYFCLFVCCPVCVCAHVCAPMEDRGWDWCLLILLSISFLRQGHPLNLELLDLATLMGHKAPGRIFLSLPLQRWHYRLIP